MILAVVWGCMNGFERNEVYWPFLIPWALVSAAYYWRRWRPGLHLSGLALTGFVVSLGYFLNHGHAHGLVVAIGLGVAAASFVGERLRPDLRGLWPGVLNYGIVIVFCGLFALQFIESPELDVFILLAVLALAITLGAIYRGLQDHNRGALWLGYIGFSFEILAIYAKTIGTILNTSLFFLVAGLIVSGLAALAHRLHKRGDTPETKTEPRHDVRTHSILDRHRGRRRHSDPGARLYAGEPHLAARQRPRDRRRGRPGRSARSFPR